MSTSVDKQEKIIQISIGNYLEPVKQLPTLKIAPPHVRNPFRNK